MEQYPVIFEWTNNLTVWQHRVKQTLEKEIKELEKERENAVVFLQTSDQRLRTNRAKASTFLYQVHFCRVYEVVKKCRYSCFAKVDSRTNWSTYHLLLLI